MIMELPKANRMAKRTIDLVHFFAASVWLCIAAVFDGNGGRNARVRYCAICPFGI